MFHFFNNTFIFSFISDKNKYRGKSVFFFFFYAFKSPQSPPIIIQGDSSHNENFIIKVIHVTPYRVHLR